MKPEPIAYEGELISQLSFQKAHTPQERLVHLINNIFPGSAERPDTPITLNDGRTVEGRIQGVRPACLRLWSCADGMHDIPIDLLPPEIVARFPASAIPSARPLTKTERVIHSAEELIALVQSMSEREQETMAKLKLLAGAAEKVCDVVEAMRAREKEALRLMEKAATILETHADRVETLQAENVQLRRAAVATHA